MSQGDEDANVVQQFERDFAEMLQETPDLQHHRSPPGPQTRVLAHWKVKRERWSKV